MNTGYTGTQINSYYTKRYTENIQQKAKIKDNRNLIQKYALKFFKTSLVIVLVYLAYSSVKLSISINAQKAIYKQNLEHYQVVQDKIAIIEEEIKAANAPNNITYRASKEIGMVKRNEATSTFIPIHEFEMVETIEETKAENYMEFNMIDAITSIFN